jgi:hypothetical protein
MAELIQAGGEKLVPAIHKLINSIWEKEELSHQWKESIIVLMYTKGDKPTNNYCEISLLSTSYKLLLNTLLSRLSPQMKILGVISVGFNISQLLIRFSAIIRYWRKKMGVQ